MLGKRRTKDVLLSIIACLTRSLESVQKLNDLKSGRKPQQEDAGTEITKQRKSESDMVPKPYDDLFIEPAGDYDIVYADYNMTLARA
ncbi:unnamed protein product [Brugia pahangi]|uniref:Reverse transcriptase domain-containing protein n=1 Tax=Brugia pahangi TaxID=6280 RepID=A0A0N4T2S4_BRUPA|nr:unnamed protein product [Brugia pahangi]